MLTFVVSFYFEDYNYILKKITYMKVENFEYFFFYKYNIELHVWVQSFEGKQKFFKKKIKNITSILAN